MKYLMGSMVGVCLILSLPVVAQETPKPGTGEVEPLNVYLFARTAGEPSKSEKKGRENELKNKKNKAEQIRKELDKKLKAEYGKDREGWPEEQQEEYRLAKEAESMVQFEIDYHRFGAVVDGKQEDLNDSVEDIMRAIQGKGIARKQKWISLVENRDQAHLLVEVLDRATSFHFNHWFGRYYEDLVLTVLAVRISPVEAFRSNRLHDIGPKEAKLVKVRHAFRKKEPYWILECASENMWRNAAAIVAGRLDMFIKDNRAVLMGEASIQ